MDCSTKQRLFLYVMSEFNSENFRSNLVNILCDGILSLQSQLNDKRSLDVLPAIKEWGLGKISDFKFYDICVAACRAASKLSSSSAYAYFAASAVAWAAQCITKIHDKISAATYASSFIDTVAEGSSILDKYI